MSSTIAQGMDLRTSSANGNEGFHVLDRLVEHDDRVASRVPFDAGTEEPAGIPGLGRGRGSHI